MLGAKKEEPVVVAIEHRAESDILDDDFADAKRRSQQFLDSSALFGGFPSSSLRPSSTTSTKRFSNVAPVSPGLFDRPFSSQNIAATASPSPSAPTARHSRRMSRHARTPSVSTKRESMEIMGGTGAGLGLDITNTVNSMGSSRRRSSRMSNLPSASLLFGAADSSSGNSKAQARASGQQWDWRKAIADAAEEAEGDVESRLSALDKLEGRTAPAQTTRAERRSSGIAEKRASRRLSHTRTESIQIPNLEEIHQNEINERRASWNAQAMGVEAPSPVVPLSAPVVAPSNRRESWGRSLLPPFSASAGFSSPALPSAYHSSPGRPESMILRPEPEEPEGLGTLMEEEEEDDATPARERASLDMPVDGSTTSAEQEIRQQQRDLEIETAKRNRRASLAPKPLKLKSRPPSLYLTPSLRNGLTSSPSMPNFGTSPLIGASIVDEATPRANSAVLAEEEAEEKEAVSTMPSRSTTCPDLTAFATVPEADEEKSFETDAEPLSAVPVSSDAVAEEAEEEAADVSTEEMEQRQLEELQQQILRAHRNSVIAPPSTSSAADTSASSTGSISRHGMRTLRLGSQANLSSIMESSSASNSGSGSISSTATTAAQRRRSLIMGPLSAAPLSGSSSRDNDYVNAFSNIPVTTSRAARRSSIIYKPSTASVPEATASPHSATDSIASLGGVPLAVHDELKAKATRDAALLESTKKQVELLERELATETERNAREKAELEQWNMDKEEHLFDRAQRAEASARQAEEAVTAVRAELEAAKEQLEDLQAEREVLVDDIEGWRSRCQDLEKQVRAEKVRSDDHRKLKAAARLRIKQLTDWIEREHGVEGVPADELGVLAALELPQMDLVGVLKSPNVGAVSPMLGSSGGLSPALGSDEAPPQITKLLASMRQQIFNLAGSLEHERKQHLLAKEEVARLQKQDPPAQSHDEEVPSGEVVAEELEQSFASTPEERDNSAESFSCSTRRSSSVLGKNKRHVFAYDSSMGSFGQSQSSASLSMTANTDDTVHTDNESDLSDSFSTKLPSSESELIGLGMGSLQTLDEIEEVSEKESVAEGTSSGTLSAAISKHSVDEGWVDMEAGGPVEVVSDDEGEEGEAVFEDAENAPPTPDLYRRSSTEASKQASSSSSTGRSTPPPPPSPRPEFHREWSFEWGKSRSKRTPSSEEPVEDFFGIFNDNILPPLSGSAEPLDLPPIVLAGNGTLLPTAKINKDGKPIQPSTTRAASIFGSRRPPVARSAYLRESFDNTRPATTTLPPQGVYGDESNPSSASSLAAIGSRALSRMSLQGLTGAFSGLSGYLTNQTGAVGAAGKMCNSLPGPGDGIQWATQRLQDQEEEEEESSYAGGRFDIESTGQGKYGASKQLSWSGGASSAVSVRQQQAGSEAGATRRFVRKSAVPPPKATPVWMLDFSRSTYSQHTTPVFSL